MDRPFTSVCKLEFEVTVLYKPNALVKDVETCSGCIGGE